MLNAPASHDRSPALDRILDAITGGSTLTSRLRKLHDRLLDTVPCVDRIACALYDAKDDLLKTFINSTRSGEPITGYEFRLSDSRSLTLLAKSGEFRVLDDIPNLIKPDTRHSRWVLKQGYQSSFTVPIYHNGLFIGLVFYDSMQPAAFTAMLQRDLVLFSNLINMAISGELSAVHSIISSARIARDFANMRDFETGEHLERMARYARLIAKAMAPTRGLTDEFITHIGVFAPLHDIGKIGIPDKVLLKSGRLDPTERKIMDTHVEKGVAIIEKLIDGFGLNQLPEMSILLNIVRCHHEYLDGSGYPAGLRGEDIPIEARIVTVADIYDALTCIRPYKKPWKQQDAVDELQRMSAAGQLDPDCVAALMDNIDALTEINRRFHDT